MDIAIMLEGQNGLDWQKWLAIAKTVEELGFAGLYRSDHYTNSNPPDLDSLECWTSLTWLATNSTKLDFGPLVSPVSFRQPTMLARMACAVDDLSGGRFQFGVGAGWQEREHHNYSWDLLDVRSRMDRFSEALNIITHLTRQDAPLSFEGAYYKVYDAVLLPRPKRRSGPPIVIGGNGPKRTLPLVAEYADEWNAVYLSAEKYLERAAHLENLLYERSRDSKTLRRSMMTGLKFGDNHEEVKKWAASRNRTVSEMKDMGVVAGTGEEIIQQLDALRRAGLDRVMLQWLDLEDLEGLHRMAEVILPEFHA